MKVGLETYDNMHNVVSGAWRLVEELSPLNAPLNSKKHSIRITEILKTLTKELNLLLNFVEDLHTKFAAVIVKSETELEEEECVKDFVSNLNNEQEAIFLNRQDLEHSADSKGNLGIEKKVQGAEDGTLENIDQKKRLSTKICSICKTELGANTITQHLESHLGLWIRCPLCKTKEVRGFTRWQVHLKKHHKMDRLACEVCGSTDVTMNCFKTHLNLTNNIRVTKKKIHKLRIKNIIHKVHRMRKKASPERKKNVHSKSTQCETCGKIFKTNVLLRVHLKSHSLQPAIKCKQCPDTFTSRDKLLRHCRTHLGDQRPFKCDQCPKSFAEVYPLRDHIKTIHLGEAHRYKCPECQTTCKNLSRLRSHLRNHSSERPFKCKECPKSFKRTSTLNRHVRIHIGDRPHKCELCQKSFLALSALNIHHRIHTGEKPFKCEECSKSFKQSSELKSHGRLHIKENLSKFESQTEIDTEEKLFKCLQCPKLYCSSSALEIHHRTHSEETPFKCLECEKSFKQAQHLRRHVLTHSGEKPFPCLKCHLAFTDSYALQRHDRIHTGEKPYNCSKCPKSFTQSNILKDHLKTHTGEKPFHCAVCSKSFTQGSNLRNHLRTHAE